MELHDLMNLNGPSSVHLRATTIGIKEAAKATGVSPEPLVTLRRRRALDTVAVFRDSVIVANFQRAEIETIARDIKRRWDLNRVTPVLGIPLYGVEQLVAMGILPVLDHRYFKARYGRVQTTEELVEGLRQQIVGHAGHCSSRYVPLRECLQAIAGRKPWGPIIGGMLGGSINFHVAEQGDTLVEAITVDKATLLVVADCGFDPSRHPFDFTTKMTKRDAGEALNLSPREYTALLRGHPTSSAPTVDVTKVEELARDFITTVELAARSARSVQEVMSLAADNGIARQSPAGYPRIAAEKKLLPKLKPRSEIIATQVPH
jgi:hypothetical protein